MVPESYARFGEVLARDAFDVIEYLRKRLVQVEAERDFLREGLAKAHSKETKDVYD